MEDFSKVSQSDSSTPRYTYTRNIALSIGTILIGILLCIVGYVLGNRMSLTEFLQGGHIDTPDVEPTPSWLRDLQERQHYDEYTGDDITTDFPDDTAEVNISFPPESGYMMRYQSVYYQEQYVEDLDLETAVYVGAGFLKDSKRLFQNGKLLPGADPARCVPEALEQCSESLRWKNLYAPYALEVAWNTAPESAADAIPAGTCRNEGYVVGKVENGPLTGGAVLAQNETECGMWCSASTPPAHTVHFVQFNNYLIPITDETGFTMADSKANLGNNQPDTSVGTVPAIDIPNSDYWLVNATTIGFPAGERNDAVTYLFTDATAGNVYRSSSDCFISTRPDHVRLSYRLGFDFINDSTGVLDINWLDGSKNTESYQFIQSYHSCYHLVDIEWLKPSERLTKVGEFPNGDPVYKFVNPRDEHLVEKYADKNTLASYEDGVNKYSYDDYVAFNPYLYWQDPFGGWVQFMNRRFETAAEKCKPVVYLYPEKTGDFSVYVQPNGGFTKTIPPYGTGWHVRATPQSRITDTVTGETYPYLYWSGVNTGVKEITEGWIVATEDTTTFLVEKLTTLGLDEQEIADFNEYWIPRFKTEGADRYKIMFLPQQDFELLSPLSVVGDETPENIIRVMMYAEPAHAGDVLPEQILPPTPARTGFTVVEWGGAMFN
jgi:hypothetical protein